MRAFGCIGRWPDAAVRLLACCGAVRRAPVRRRPDSTARAATTPTSPSRPAIRRPARRAASARDAAAPGASPIRARAATERDVLAQEPGDAAGRGQLLRLGREGRGRAGAQEPGRSNSRSTAPAATIATWTSRPTRPARSARQACEAEQRCRAWTYVRPGYLGPSARCFLKERVTTPRRKPCCVSGVVR